jgi:hypothetical protein
MKHHILTLLFVCSFISNFAQSPPGIPYQSALRNASGGILANLAVSLRFSIHDSLAGGNIVYQETHANTTNAQGIVSLNIGQGVPLIGTFAQIDWSKNYKFLQIEMDPSGGTNYIDLGTQQMMSVPFALYSNSAGEVKPKGSDLQTLIYTNNGF